MNSDKRVNTVMQEPETDRVRAVRLGQKLEMVDQAAVDAAGRAFGAVGMAPSTQGVHTATPSMSAVGMAGGNRAARRRAARLGR